MEASLSTKYGVPDPIKDGLAKDYATNFGLIIRLLPHADHATIIKLRNLLQDEMAE